MSLTFALLVACVTGTPPGADVVPVDSGEAAVPACDDDPGVTWDSFAHGFFLNYCQACHASANTEARFGAPPPDHFDTEAAVRSRADRVRARVLDEQTMPVGGGVNPDDLVLLDTYLRCVHGR